jgi:transposase-like protein
MTTSHLTRLSNNDSQVIGYSHSTRRANNARLVAGYGAGAKPVSAEQMELARLKAELARVKMEHDILKKATVYFAREFA